MFYAIDFPILFVIEAFNILIKNKVDVNVRSTNESTALFYAIRYSSVSVRKNIIKILIDNNANINAKEPDGTTPILAATSNNDIESINLLLDYDADVTAKNKLGYTPLLYSRVNNKYTLIELFVKKGLDVNIKDNVDYSCLLHAAKNNIIDAIKLLITHKSDVNVRGAVNDKDDGCTSILYASYFNNFDAVKLLIANGADVNMNGSIYYSDTYDSGYHEGYNSLFFAVRNSSLSC